MRGLETGPLEATQADEVAGVWRADERRHDGEALTTPAAELLLADGFEPRTASTGASACTSGAASLSTPGS